MLSCSRIYAVYLDLWCQVQVYFGLHLHLGHLGHLGQDGHDGHLGHCGHRRPHPRAEDMNKASGIK